LAPQAGVLSKFYRLFRSRHAGAAGTFTIS
jgi:hypothetical protein